MTILFDTSMILTLNQTSFAINLSFTLPPLSYKKNKEKFKRNKKNLEYWLIEEAITFSFLLQSMEKEICHAGTPKVQESQSFKFTYHFFLQFWTISSIIVLKMMLHINGRFIFKETKKALSIFHRQYHNNWILYYYFYISCSFCWSK